MDEYQNNNEMNSENNMQDSQPESEATQETSNSPEAQDSTAQAENQAPVSGGTPFGGTPYSPPEKEEQPKPAASSQYTYSGTPYSGTPFGQAPVNGAYQSPVTPGQNGGYQQQPYSQAPQFGAQYYQQQPYQAPSKPPKKKRRGLRVFCVLLAIVVVFSGFGVGVSFATRKYINNKQNGEDTTNQYIAAGDDDSKTTVNSDGPSLDISETPTAATGATGTALTSKEIAAKAKASTVGVLVYSSQQLAGEGSGIIMNADASNKYTYVITCAHVISTSGITAAVQFEDGERYDAEIVGYDQRTDIGVLKFQKTGFPAAEFGDSDALSVGDTIYAMGNPGGVDFFGSFTKGMVSAIGRTIQSEIGYDMECIQHDAAISPGNSGGSLLNEYGQVIGINSAKISSTDYEGMGFAIPIKIAKNIVDSLIAYGYVPNRPKLGIKYLANNSSSLNSIYSMAVQLKGLPSGSLVIAQIDKDSNLINTDAKVGDLIIAANGKKLDKADVLLELIEKGKVGDTLTLTLCRIESGSGRYTVSDPFDVKIKLVEDMGSGADEEETTTQNFFSNGGNGNGNYSYNPFGW